MRSVNDRVVADLVAPRAEWSPFAADPLLADAVGKGWLTPPLRKDGDLPPRTPVALWADVAAELDSDREDR